MQAAAAHGRYGGTACAMQQSCIGDATPWMDAAIVSDNLVPCRFALTKNLGIA
jgi:hypothetical protein